MISNYNLQYPPIKTKLESNSETEHTLFVEPLMPGFGYTIGNSLRRILLSSIPGFGITKVKINDITHEYQAIEDIKEDALEVLLNIKALRAKILTDEDKAVLQLNKTKGGEVTAKDFDKNAGIEIVNDDLYICNLNSGGKLNIEVEVARGFGYLPLEKRDLRGNTDPKALLMDVVYTPVSNVALDVDQVRVGDQTNFDKVSLKFTTDGTATGREVAEFALKLFVDLASNTFSSFQASQGLETTIKETSSTKKTEKPTKSEVAKEEEEGIDLPARIKKILEKNGVTTNSELKKRAEEVAEFPGLGEKTLQKINDYLKGLK